MCDSHCRFIFFDISNPGGQPDLNCYTNSQLFQWIMQGFFPIDSVVGGDKAFLSQQGDNLFAPFSDLDGPRVASRNLFGGIGRNFLLQELGGDSEIRLSI